MPGASPRTRAIRSRTSMSRLSDCSTTPRWRRLSPTRSPPRPSNPFAASPGNNPATHRRYRPDRIFAVTIPIWKWRALRAGGSLFEAPGGNAYLTVGAEYPTTEFRHDDVGPRWRTVPGMRLRHPSRHARISVARARRVRGATRATGRARRTHEHLLRALEVSFGGRAEDYSDIGRAAVPKTAFTWSPVPDVTVRGTWTKSFRPPALPDLSTANSRSELITLPNASSPSGVHDGAGSPRETIRTWRMSGRAPGRSVHS